MGRIVLVGEPGKRRDYMALAASQAGVELFVCSWESYLQDARDNDVVKLDPPSLADPDMGLFQAYSEAYLGMLGEFGQLEASRNVKFLNSPQDIAAALDKIQTKERLLALGVATPRRLMANSRQELVEAMDRDGEMRVFVKPRYGSGASGVLAYQRSRKGRIAEILETSLVPVPPGDGGFGVRYANTRRIRRYTDPDTVAGIIDFVFSLGAICEVWVPKASKGPIKYDARIVWQGGRAAWTVLRGSRGPITNLHLNNMALDFSLDPAMQLECEDACRLAAKAFGGLYVAGFDVLVQAGGGTPMILEVNGQGDLIYQDIYATNSIYAAQIQALREMANV